MERRLSKRIPLELPVQAGEERGTLRDISESGVYFISSGSYHIGDQICFSFELKHIVPDKPLHFSVTGHVARMERLGDKTGVAVTIEKYRCLH